MTGHQPPEDQRPAQDRAPGGDEAGATPSAAVIVGLLAEEDRLRVAAALVLGAGSLAEVVEATALAPRDAAKALDRLTRGGLVVSDAGGARFATERLRAASRVAFLAQTADEPADADGAATHRDPVLRSFVNGGRLVSIPAARGKRRVVLEWLAGRFDPGRTYPESETNRLLNETHPDHAALRRYLVDEGFLERRDGFYWRSGGPVDVD